MHDHIPFFELKEIDFERISRLVYEQCGINLHEGKKELVKARLGKRLREGNFKSFGDYYRYVISNEGTDELISMIDSLSTNLTYFFREESHFRKLSEVAPAMLKESGGPSPKLRIWSAGCSTGEEPYTIAMILREAIPHFEDWDIEILATDASSEAMEKAKRGIYNENSMRLDRKSNV